MENKPSKSTSPPRHKGQTGRILPYLLCLCLGALAVFFYFRYVDQDHRKVPANLDSPAKEHSAAGDSGKDGKPTGSSMERPAATTGNLPANQTGGPDQNQNGTPVDSTESTAKSIGATEQETATSPNEQAGGCEQITARINAFYTHLDQQEYMKQFGLDAPSQIYFARLIQRLIDNPPVVTRETDDLFTVLKNTAHFFRIIGKNNIQLLKGILDQEKESFEEMLADFYVLTSQPPCLEKAFGIKLPQSALDDYAGFFLNTMGGRLYLFRRDSVSRMVVNYYAILIIEQANTEGNNSRGIEIKAAVDGLITEIENSGTQLKLKERYLDKLYEIKEKYL